MDATFTPWPETFAARYRDEGLWTGETFSDVLTQRASAHPERVAVISADTILTYQQLRDTAENIAGGLYDLGLRGGDTVVLQAFNDANFLCILFGLFRLGAIPVCALPAHREAEIGYFCQHARATAYIHPDATGYRHIADQMDVPRDLTVTRVARLTSATIPPATEAADLALLQLSGGSTGVPKLIPRTHDDYLYSVRIANEVCGVSADSVYLCALPAAHNFPLSSPGTLGILCAGGTVVMASDPSPDCVFGLLMAHDVTMTAVVPSLALTWMRAARARRQRFEHLEVLQIGGARIDDHAAARVSELLGAKPQQVFGMAEGLVCYTRLDDPEDIAHTTQGRPASPFDEVRVVDDEDNDVADGQSGHLLTRGPYTVRGYYRAAAYNAVAFTPDGFYRTGDLVRRTTTGHLVVTGRAKEQINRGGEKIATAEIEEHLRSHPGIADAALLAVPDEALGERACAACVGTDPDLNGVAVRHYLRERGLAAYKIPDLVRFTDALPRTAIGKVDKKALKEQLSL